MRTREGEIYSRELREKICFKFFPSWEGELNVVLRSCPVRQTFCLTCANNFCSPQSGGVQSSRVSWSELQPVDPHSTSVIPACCALYSWYGACELRACANHHTDIV